MQQSNPDYERFTNIVFSFQYVLYCNLGKIVTLAW